MKASNKFSIKLLIILITLSSGHFINAQSTQLMLDDISLTFDGGSNQIENGSFSDGFIHWNTWDDETDANRVLNDIDYYSDPASYEFIQGTTQGYLRTFYTKNIESVDWEIEENPYGPLSSIWIEVTTGTEAILNFWYKKQLGAVFILGLDNLNQEHILSIGENMTYASSWVNYSDTITITEEIVSVAIQFDSYAETTGFADFEVDEFSVYPNPATDKLYIECNLPIRKINLININGHILLETNYPEIDLFNIKCGLYILSIETDTKIYFEKVLVNQ